MCLGERLKESEQSLIFLKKCRDLRIFPVFIKNSFKFPDFLFPTGSTLFSKQLLFKLRLQALNQNINFKYQYIQQLKSDIHQLRVRLQSEVPSTMYRQLIDAFNQNNDHTKVSAKQRLSQKFNWLIYKYYSYEWFEGRFYVADHRYTVTYNEDDPRFNTGPNTQSVPHVTESEQPVRIQTPEEKVTCVNVETTSLPQGATKLLALGPGYAISPSNSKKSMNQIVMEISDRIADAAIRMRWNNHFKDRPSAQTLDQYLKSVSPFDKKHTKPPPTDNLDLENRMVQFSDLVRNIVKNTKVTPNLTRNQRSALKDLRDCQELHLSIADKTSEFVVMRREDHIRATKQHFDDPAYRKLDMPSTEKEVTKFIAKLTKSLEEDINAKWHDICQKRNLSNKVYNLFAAHHSTLPTGRILIKTHKHQTAEISNIPAESLKVRPIVSNCNSPMDRITFLLCHLLKPLLDMVPSHLKNTHDALVKLRDIPQSDLRGKSFFTADVEALYTNINVETAIRDIMELAEEHRSHLQLLGLTLTDVHELLETSLLNSYFVYDRQVYVQRVGFFMGVRPAPIGAIIKMWKLERNSIYTDLRISPLFYGRFYDDLSSITSNSRRAQLMCNLIEDQDPDHLIKLTVDYPETRDHYTPFLNMEVKVSQDGSLDTRLYRKPQKKLLTLNAESHHPASVKEHTISSMYKTATSVSSNSTNTAHSKRMIDELLLNNGYSNRVIERIKSNKRKRKRKRLNTETNNTTLKLPFLSDVCTAKIKRAANSLKIPVRVVTTPGRKLRNLLTSSRPLDRPQCPNNNCQTCEALEDHGKCTDRNVVYNISCDKAECKRRNIGQYNGETYRPLGDRFVEHWRSAKNPTADSYKEKPFGKHYATEHPDHSGNPELKLRILTRASSTTDRKIKEARAILKNNPDLNDRDEQSELRKYLI